MSACHTEKAGLPGRLNVWAWDTGHHGTQIHTDLYGCTQIFTE